jgi:hypothetical protein
MINRDDHDPKPAEMVAVIVTTLFLAIVMFFAWRKPVIGFFIFGIAAIFLLRFVLFGRVFGAGNFMMFVAPLALISGLFWINWKWRDVMTMGKAVG